MRETIAIRRKCKGEQGTPANKHVKTVAERRTAKKSGGKCPPIL